MQFRTTNPARRDEWIQRGKVATAGFGLRREAELVAKRPVETVVLVSNAAFGRRPREKRCRRFALPPQSKFVVGKARTFVVVSNCSG